MYSGGNSGFTDLRVGHGARGIGDDSVWPSFTDIMTVIVMIFLMALVIMMVRNFELDRQLTTTVSAREASLLENRNLVSRLNVLEARVVGLQGSLGESVSERDALRTQLLDELRRIELLAADNVNLEEQLAAIIEERNLLAREKQQLVEQGEAALGRITDLTATEEELREEIAALSKQFGDLQLSSGREIESLTFANRSLSEQLATVSSQLSDLIAASGREIEALTRTNLSLSEQLEAVSSQLSALQLSSGREIESLTGANLSLSEQREVLASQLAQVRGLLETEQQQRRALGARVEEQDLELSAGQRLLKELQLSQEQAAQRNIDARAEIERLSRLIRRRQAENAALQELADAAGEQFRSLQQEYEALDAKYRDLVRPARSPAGKYVVDVRFSKWGDQYRFQLKEPAQSQAADYSREQLARRLAALKERHGDDLYTRVVIPEDNQLTHNEAWRFTQEILQGYDYYYQQYPDALGGSAAPQ
ncbi:MAG: hypothetical protein OXU22_09465 [Gammaproteobacteria bacterium]|nr:hypothetical protein [Gammaproteobacteria bacterium]